jgi:hypothetical protein
VARSNNSARAALNGYVRPTPARTDADAMLDTLAAAIAPRVAKLLREGASGDDDDAMTEILARAGYVVVKDGEP